MTQFGRPPSREKGKKSSRPRTAPNPPPGAAGGGARGIRQLRRSRNEQQLPQQGASSKENRQGGGGKARSRVDLARVYLADRVDPLMGEIINYLLLEQPAEADLAILKFLQGRQQGKAPRPVSSRASRNAVLRDRLYMARQVQPVLEVLIRKVVDEQPYDVESHFIKLLIQRRAVPGGSAAGPGSAGSPGGGFGMGAGGEATVGASAGGAPLGPPLGPPPTMSRGACDALFRMLDEDGEGSLAVSHIVERIRRLSACGVPIDATALAFWERVDLSSSNIDGASGKPPLAMRRLDHDRFFGTMGRVCLSAEKWMGSGVTPKLGDYIILSVNDGVVAPPPDAEVPAAAAAAAVSSPVGAPAEDTAGAAPSSSPPPKPAEPMGFVVGARCLVNYRKSGNYFAGKLAKEHPNGNFDIAYDDGDSEKNVARKMIQPLGADGQPLPIASSAEEAPAPALPSAEQPPSLAVGCRVEVRYKGKGNWYKGKLVAEENGTFSVAYDDGDSEEKVVPANVRLLGEDGAVVPVPGTASDLEAMGAAAKVEGGPQDLAHVKPVVALVGVKGAGKSTLLKAMGGDPEPKPRPTTGFMQRKLQFEVRGVPVLVHWYDLPGGWKTKWETYLTEVHGVVFVVDAAAAEEDFAEAVGAFKGAVMTDNARVVAGKPMLVLANKQDEPRAGAADDSAAAARSAEDVAAAMGVAELCGEGGEGGEGGGEGEAERNWKVEACSCHPMKVKGSPEGESQFDPKVEGGLEWLLERVVDQYETLQSRVTVDAAAAERAREAEKLERKKRVMCKVLKEKAFPAEGEPMETFPGADGYEFFAMELLIHDPQVPEHVEKNSGANDWGLSPEAKVVAQLVGFQKMAMQMCAEMINPENKKTKVTHTWEEVTAYVKDRRVEAGLARELPE